MSSFDYTDNFSGFNDLFNRIEILQEKDWKSMVGSAKLRPEFAKYEAEDPKTGDKAPPGGLSRLANILFVTALGEAHLGIIDSKTSAILRKPPYATSSTKIPQALKELEPEAFEELFREKNPRSVEVSEYVKNPEKLEELVKDTIINFTKRDREYVKKVDSEDLADAVGDAVDDIENAADTIGGDFKKEIDEIVSADPTTFIEIKIQDMDRAEDVSKMVSRYANEDGVEITNDGVQFSIDPEMPLAIAAKNLALKGLEQKIESELQGDISRVTDNIVILHLPQKVIDQAETELRFKDLPGAEEDYEQDMYGMEGNESYAANENEVQEDNEEERQRRENEREEARDRAREAEDKGDWEKWNEEENKRERARDQLRDSEDNELDHFLTKEQPEDDIPATDYESVIADLVSKDKKEHALKQLNGDKDDGGHIDDMRAEYPPDPFGGGYEDEEFSYSPMLDSYQSDTAGYLIEQAASDKRNKKTEVKPQSFKEKYKPKTHWQLEELRRYGL